VVKKVRSVAVPIPPEAESFAADFRSALLRVHEGFKPPTDRTFLLWQHEARRMVEIDGRTFVEARHLAVWLFRSTDEGAVFWRSVILSLPKFRDKYDALKAKAHSRQEGKNDGFHGSAILRAAEAHHQLKRAARASADLGPPVLGLAERATRELRRDDV
jgi:hypothetical protein